MEKHLLHQDNSFSCQQLFLEPGPGPDIEHIIVKNQMQKPALMDNFLVENLYLIRGKKCQFETCMQLINSLRNINRIKGEIDIFAQDRRG